MLGCLQFLAAPLSNLLFLRTHVAAEACVHKASEVLRVLITESHIQVVSLYRAMKVVWSMKVISFNILF